ncbi:MAG: alpha/beta hydrolase [Mogibacterium sp.]|nr:alpha/beta hydrolase [Mogibacterium sp.]
MKILLLIILIAAALIIALGFALASYSMRNHPQTLEEARAWQEDHYDIFWYDQLEKEGYVVRSFDDYELHVEVLYNPVMSDRYILISHGYTDNHFGSLKYTKMYLDLGFNVILYDLRGHGQNELTHCTYSIRESRDLKVLIEDCRKRFPDAKVFGIHGESLGSATSIAVLKYKPEIDFVVADCGFSEIRSVMAAGLRGMHLPVGLVGLASVCAKIRYGHYFEEMRPIDSLQDNEVPILFMHGTDDDFILPFHSENMNEANKGYSELHMIEGATHAASVLADPDRYRECVEAFFRTIGVLQEEPEHAYRPPVIPEEEIDEDHPSLP